MAIRYILSNICPSVSTFGFSWYFVHVHGHFLNPWNFDIAQNALSTPFLKYMYVLLSLKSGNRGRYYEI